MHAERKRTEGRRGRLFNYANNPTTLAGVVLTTVSAISISAFILAEMAGGLRNPYLGIFAYMILPAFFVLGLILIPIGMGRRRAALIAAGLSIEERAAYPRLDFNDPQLRRAGAVVLLLTAVNAIIFGASSYLAVEHLETVEFCGTACHLMEPEYTAYQASPHSRVACVECHIGPGASWFVRSKLDGVRQVWKTTLDSYERPIGTPIHDLRPARETCEQCHWPAKHHGDKLKVIARFGTDETNRPSYSAMVLRTGGGSLEVGRAGGIHWRHIEADNRIRYVSQDDDREQIVWVELTTPDGERRVYTREGEELPAPPELELRARTMDCIDCHNRPTHLFEVPANALDQELAARPELVGLPYFKGQALAAIEGSYATREAGIEAVREAVLAYYRSSHPEVWAGRTKLIETGAAVAAGVYARSVFPEMDTDWETHPNHIGHEQSPGCWRCHDEELATPGGEHVISMDCELCHVFLVEGSPTPPDPGGLLGSG